MTGSNWLVDWSASSQARTRIVAFPHAGAGAAAYAPWARLLPAHVRLTGVRMPGRENRYAEPPLRSVSSVVDQVAPLLVGPEPERGVRTVLFGYSLGALIAYEVAVRLQELGSPVALLAVGGSNAPHAPRPRLPMSELDGPEFTAAIRDLGGTPPEVFDHPELMAIVLPTLRADFAMLDAYRAGEKPPLVCPVSTFSGDRDDELSEPGTAAWGELTTARLTRHTFAGGHFFLVDRADELVAALLEDAAIRVDSR